jgi:hypothetical protein
VVTNQRNVMMTIVNLKVILMLKEQADPKTLVVQTYNHNVLTHLNQVFQLLEP